MSEKEEYTLVGPPTDIPFKYLWKAMVEKVYHPDRFLPVTDVLAVDKTDPESNQAYIHREMTLQPADRTPLRIKENIYSDEEAGRIDFVTTKDGRNIVNCIDKETGVIRYYKETSRGSNEKIDWVEANLDDPKPILVTIEKASEYAKEEGEN
jgi:Domain of unknown function (DUF1857)